MELRPADRLIIIMLTDIYKKLGISGEVDAEFISAALYGHHTWALDMELTHLIGGDDVRPNVKTDVLNILDMFSLIERSYKPQKAALAIADDHWLEFHGFDGNHETDYMSVARFLVDDMGRFTEFAKRDFNSHMPTVDTYLAMYRVFERIRDDLSTRHDLQLTKDEFEQLIDAARGSRI